MGNRAAGKSKVLAFDSWTRGAPNLERLIPALAAKDMTLGLVHLGSWGNEPDRPEREQVGELPARDIRSYRGMGLDAVLEEERPDAVILLSTDTFAHRAFLRYCRQRSIPSIHLYHGLMAVLDTSDPAGAYAVGAAPHARFLVSKLYKTVRRTLPCYAGSLLSTRAPLREWRRFATDVLDMGVGRIPLITGAAQASAEDARTTACCVYAPADVGHATSRYGFSPAEVAVVGNPDLIRFGIPTCSIGAHAAALSTSGSEVMYIDTGLSLPKIRFDGVTHYARHLEDTSRGLAAQGIRLLVKPKPHPADYARELTRLLEKASIEVVGNEAFVARLQRCVGCIVEPTTLAMVPAVMGMPLLFGAYGELAGMRFGTFLRSYPRGQMLEELSAVAPLLRRDAERLDRAALQEWIAVNAGPLPFEDMPKRVAEVVERLVRGRAPAPSGGAASGR